MKKFLAVYIGSATEEEKKSTIIPQDVINKGMEAWGAWVTENSNSIVEMGGPLGKTISASKNGISASKNSLTGYVIVQAASHQDASNMFIDHPHFAIFPGDSVEIMECLDIPEA